MVGVNSEVKRIINLNLDFKLITTNHIKYQYLL